MNPNMSPMQEEPLREVGEEEDDFFHLTADDGMGLSIPLDNEEITRRSLAARAKLEEPESESVWDATIEMSELSPEVQARLKEVAKHLGTEACELLPREYREESIDLDVTKHLDKLEDPRDDPFD